MSCPLANHDKQRIKYVCVDKICQYRKKIGCADCFLEHHATHKRQRLEDFQQQARTQACTLLNIKANVLREDDISFKSYEFDNIINDGLIDRQKIQAKEIWKQKLKHRVYDKNKKELEESQTKINRMEEIINEKNFNQSKYQELAGIYFDPGFWSNMLRNKMEESVQINKIVKSKEKYFTKILNVADNLLRELNIDEQKSNSYEESEPKLFASPEQQKDTTQRKYTQIKTRHFGSTAQQLFNIAPSKKYKFIQS